MANEMKRACRPDGFILWYDFIYNNPRNPAVRGISRKKVEELFGAGNCHFRSVTLAPQISRLIAPFSWFAAETAETFLPFLRTHIIAVITPEPERKV
jgi:hypothetical protein